MTCLSYLEVLDRQEALRLLGSAPVVRLAYCQDGEAHVVPVNALLVDDEVVVRTSYGGKLSAAARTGSLTVEADVADPATRTGWSVSVVGPARVLDDDEELARPELAAVDPWAPGVKEVLLAVRCAQVSGRRIALPPG